MFKNRRDVRETFSKFFQSILRSICDFGNSQNFTRLINEEPISYKILKIWKNERLIIAKLNELNKINKKYVHCKNCKKVLKFVVASFFEILNFCYSMLTFTIMKALGEELSYSRTPGPRFWGKIGTEQLLKLCSNIRTVIINPQLSIHT